MRAYQEPSIYESGNLRKLYNFPSQREAL